MCPPSATAATLTINSNSNTNTRTLLNASKIESPHSKNDWLRVTLRIIRTTICLMILTKIYNNRITTICLTQPR